MEVTVTPRAVRYARKRGGRIYIWIGSQGFTHVATTKPDMDPAYWQSHHLRTDVTVHVPREPDASWTVDRRPLPWAHLFVTSNMMAGMPPLSGGPGWH